MTSHTLPDNPGYAFCPDYALGDEPQQIRIVIDGMAGNAPPRFRRQAFAWTALATLASQRPGVGSPALRLDRELQVLPARHGRLRTQGVGEG